MKTEAGHDWFSESIVQCPINYLIRCADLGDFAMMCKSGSSVPRSIGVLKAKAKGALRVREASPEYVAF